MRACGVGGGGWRLGHGTRATSDVLCGAVLTSSAAGGAAGVAELVATGIVDTALAVASTARGCMVNVAVVVAAPTAVAAAVPPKKTVAATATTVAAIATTTVIRVTVALATSSCTGLCVAAGKKAAVSFAREGRMGGAGRTDGAGRTGGAGTHQPLQLEASRRRSRVIGDSCSVIVVTRDTRIISSVSSSPTSTVRSSRCVICPSSVS